MNDIVGMSIPETKKFPPTNETMIIMTPTFREWKATQLHAAQLQHIIPLYPRPTYNLIQPSLSLLDDREEVGRDIIVMNFKAACDEDLEVSVIIEDTLSSMTKKVVIKKLTTSKLRPTFLDSSLNSTYNSVGRNL